MASAAALPQPPRTRRHHLPATVLRRQVSRYSACTIYWARSSPLPKLKKIKLVAPSARAPSTKSLQNLGSQQLFFSNLQSWSYPRTDIIWLFLYRPRYLSRYSRSKEKLISLFFFPGSIFSDGFGTSSASILASNSGCYCSHTSLVPFVGLHGSIGTHQPLVLYSSLPCASLGCLANLALFASMELEKDGESAGHELAIRVPTQLP